MAYELKDRLYLSILFNDKEFPNTVSSSFDYVHMKASTAQRVPSVTLSLRDGDNWLASSGVLGDGTRITIVVRAGSAEAAESTQYQFRFAACRENRGDNSTTYVIDGLLDVPKYLASTASGMVEGTSSVALKTVAAGCGMAFRGVGTSDSQKWYINNRSIANFVQYVTERGYATEDSCMISGVDFDQTLIYRDITSMEVPVNQIGLRDLSGANGLPAMSFYPETSSGALNYATGYSGQAVEQKLTGDTTNTKHQAIGAQVNDQGSLMVNSEVKSQIKEGAVRYGPIDPGNSHDNSERARYQNQRGLALFNSRLVVSIPIASGVSLLDTVSVSTSLIEQDDPATKAFSGSYRVFSKIIYIAPGLYAEKITLGRRTLNIALDNSQSLAATSSQPTKSVDLKAPVSSILSIPSLDLSSLVSMAESVGATVVAAASGVLSSATTAVTNATNALTSAPNVQPPIDALLADITSITNAGVAAINAVLVTDPLDTAGAVPGIRTDYKGQIDTAISDQLPAIAALADRSMNIATTSSSLAGAQNTLTTLTGKLAGFSTAVSGALNKLAYTPSSSISGAASAAESSITSTASDTTTAVGSAVSSAQATADSLYQSASTYQATIDAAKAAGYATLDATGPAT